MMHDAYLGSTARQGKYGECTGRMTGCSSRGNGGAALFDSQTFNVLDEPRDIPWISLNPYKRGQAVDYMDMDLSVYSNRDGYGRRYRN